MDGFRAVGPLAFSALRLDRECLGEPKVTPRYDALAAAARHMVGGCTRCGASGRVAAHTVRRLTKGETHSTCAPCPRCGPVRAILEDD